MSKNFFYKRTGHKPSDKYFKNMAVWHDVDLMKSWMLGFFAGSILTIFLITLFYLFYFFLLFW